jgi:hypothetical protein
VVEADLITVIWPLGLDNSRDIDLATVIVFANFFFWGRPIELGCLLVVTTLLSCRLYD